MGIPSIDRAIGNLLKWAARGEWDALQSELYAAHFEPVVDGVDLSDDALAVLPDDVARMLSMFIIEDFFTTEFGEHGERNVIDDYLKRRGWRESVPGRRYLEALRNSTVSLYEVVDVVPGRCATCSSAARWCGSRRSSARRARRGGTVWRCASSRCTGRTVSRVPSSPSDTRCRGSS